MQWYALVFCDSYLHKKLINIRCQLTGSELHTKKGFVKNYEAFFCMEPDHAGRWAFTARPGVSKTEELP